MLRAILTILIFLHGFAVEYVFASGFYGSGIVPVTFRPSELVDLWTLRFPLNGGFCPTLLAEYGETTGLMHDLANGGYGPLDDWWQDRDRPELAEMIGHSKRLWQIAGDRPLSLVDDAYFDAAALHQERLTELLRENGRVWLSGVRNVGSFFLIRNGIIWGISIDAGRYLHAARWIREHIPSLRYLHLTNTARETVSKMQPLHFTGIHTLILDPIENNPDTEAWALPALPDIEYLDVHGHQIDWSSVALGQLKGIAMNRLTPRFQDAMARLRFEAEGPRLEEFVVRETTSQPGMVFIADMLRWLAPTLRVLKLPALASDPWTEPVTLPKLERLSLGEGIYRDFFEWKAFESLKWLQLTIRVSGANAIELNEEAQRMLRALPSGLRHLKLYYQMGGCYQTVPAMDWDGSYLGTLRHLHISFSHPNQSNHWRTNWGELKELRRLVLEDVTPFAGTLEWGAQTLAINWALKKIFRLPELRALVFNPLSTHDVADVEGGEKLRQIDILPGLNDESQEVNRAVVDALMSHLGQSLRRTPLKVTAIDGPIFSTFGIYQPALGLEELTPGARDIVGGPVEFQP